MQPYFFGLTICSPRTGAALGIRTGVVFADSFEAAEALAWKEHGGDNACKLWVEEIPQEGCSFTAYKSEIR